MKSREKITKIKTPSRDYSIGGFYHHVFPEFQGAAVRTLLHYFFPMYVILPYVNRSLTQLYDENKLCESYLEPKFKKVQH